MTGRLAGGPCNVRLGHNNTLEEIASPWKSHPLDMQIPRNLESRNAGPTQKRVKSLGKGKEIWAKNKQQQCERWGCEETTDNTRLLPMRIPGLTSMYAENARKMPFEGTIESLLLKAPPSHVVRLSLSLSFFNPLWQSLRSLWNASFPLYLQANFVQLKRPYFWKKNDINV